MDNEARGRQTIVFVSSGAPFGVTELWFQAEVRSLDETFDVVLAPTWPRGARSRWLGRTLTDSGHPPIAPLRTLRALVRSRELRRLLWSTRDTFNGRTRWKCVLSFFVALQWSFQIDDLDLDVCHVHAMTVAAPATGAAVLAIRLGCGSSATAHRGDIVRRSPRHAIQRLDLVRAISQNAKVMLARDGIDASVLRFGALDGVSPASVATPSHRLSMVAIGHLSVMKAHDRALDIVAGARERGVDLALEVFGAGALEQQLLARIDELALHEVVHLRGFLSHEDLLTELTSGRWNALLHPSLEEGDVHEGLPVCILEAAASGMPVVVSRSGSTPEFIVDGVNGLLFDARDRELAVAEGIDAVCRLAGDLDLQARLGEQARLDAVAYTARVTTEVMATALGCTTFTAER